VLGDRGVRVRMWGGAKSSASSVVGWAKMRTRRKNKIFPWEFSRVNTGPEIWSGSPSNRFQHLFH
jgi:hypothetical protein